MPHMLGPAESEPFRLTLNTDGRPHTRENILAVGTFLVGVLAFILGFVVSAHVVATALGIIGFAGGLFAQYVSVTTPQRSIIIMGIVASFVGALLGIAHGGFS
ncbi:hypothetical protein Aph01nite_78800 [Acrocarpospora phusangensis]|uniref:Uncharacterized protein n=1 Tax=Acrocarpospora phusangensis TaxID=1070424 RepID=A0A919UVN5_9ACTN|nr:hypothetical protein [Acrocarpospora phusangensis]GIH29570.1 hypothetical protein Aph01nite_78800 [Acrocarpospora phusangensis]